MIIVNFNSHAHVERDYQIITVIISKSNFNSHAHVERDKLEGLIGASGRISTHTLTWSVTYFTQAYDDVDKISTHTLTWSVTSRKRQRLFCSNYFNSHAHVERDFSKFQSGKVNAISTHTLTWSVTPIVDICSTIRTISTHTLTWSVTIRNILTRTINRFQLTRSRGA